MADAADTSTGPSDPTSQALNANIERRTATWHKHIRANDPGPADPVARSKWADEHETAVKRSMSPPKHTAQKKVEASKPDEASTEKTKRALYTFKRPNRVKW